MKCRRNFTAHNTARGRGALLLGSSQGHRDGTSAKFKMLTGLQLRCRDLCALLTTGAAQCLGASRLSMGVMPTRPYRVDCTAPVAHPLTHPAPCPLVCLPSCAGIVVGRRTLACLAGHSNLRDGLRILLADYGIRRIHSEGGGRRQRFAVFNCSFRQGRCRTAL